MKHTRHLTMVLVLLLVTAFAYLLGDFNQQMKKQNVYVNRIDDQKMALDNLPAPLTDLEQRLAEVSAINSNVQQAAANTTLNTTTFIDFLLAAADRFNLLVSPIKADNWNLRTVGATTYKVFPVEVHLKGQFSELVSFLDQIDDSNRYPYLVIESVLVIPVDMSVLSAGIATSSQVTAHLDLALIVRQTVPITGDKQ